MECSPRVVMGTPTCACPSLGYHRGGHDAVWVCGDRLLIFNTSSERPLAKLSENHKINVIRPTELKLWPFKDADLFNATL